MTAAGSVVEVTEATFEREVMRCPLPVLVDFWAPWCRPCRVVASSTAEVAKIVAGRARVVRVNLDRNRDLGRRYGVRDLPTVMLFTGGEVVEGWVGIRTKEEYLRLLTELVFERKRCNRPEFF